MNVAFNSYPMLGNRFVFDSCVKPSAFVVEHRLLNDSPPSSRVFYPAVSFDLTRAGISQSIDQIVVDRVADLSVSLRQRIEEISRLPRNWDGEGAGTIKSYVLADVVETLIQFEQRIGCFKEPFIAPTRDGFVQMEWHGNRRSLEIEAVAEGWVLVGTLIDVNNKRQYLAGECERSDFAKLEAFYHWYVGEEWIWPSQ